MKEIQRAEINGIEKRKIKNINDTKSWSLKISVKLTSL